MSKILLKKLEEALESGELLQYVDESLAHSQVLAKIGYAKKGQYISVVRDFLETNDIVVSHFTSNGKPTVSLITKVCLYCGKEFNTWPRKEKEQVTCSKACSNSYFRSGTNHPNYRGRSYRDAALKYYGHVCTRCGYSEHTAAIVVHHRDHNRDNNSLDNLEVLCANCHAIHHWGN